MYTIKVSIKDMTTLLAALQHYTLDLKDDPIRQQAAALNLNVGEQVLNQCESVEAFEAAIAAGYLSNDPAAENYAGNYMYMGEHELQRNPIVVKFKHIMTREYLIC